MDGQDYKGGLKKRPKLAVINMDSDDDEPIRSFLKLKSKRNNKKVKLEIDGVKGKKIEVKGEKDVVGDEDLGGMEDTLASFRKKLKGPKKDGGSGSLLKKELALNLAELSDGCLDRPQNGEDFVAELAKGDEDKVGHVTSDVNNGQKSEKKRERKSNSSKSASAAKILGGAVNSDGVAIEKVDSSENQMERQEGQTMHKKKTRRSKSVLAGSSLRASVDLDDGEFPDEHALEDQAEVKEGLSSMLEKNLLEGQTKHKNKARRSKSVFAGNSLRATVDLDDGEIPDEHTLVDLVEGKEGLSSMLEENLADSLSSFLKKAQKVHSGSHKKSRASACTKSAGVQILSDRGPSPDCVSSDSQSFPGRNTLSDKELGSENQKSDDHLSGSGHICLSDPQVRSDGDQDLDVLNGNQLQSAPISDPMNCDSPTTGERSGDVRGGDTSEPIVAVPIVQESSCSLVACAEKKGELKSSEVCGEAGVTQDEPLIDSLDKLCEKDASESPSAEIKKQCTSGTQNDELYNGVSLCDPLNSSSRVVDVACSSSGSELMAELSNPERHESNVISDAKCGEDVIDTVRVDPLRADNVRGDGAPKEILVDEAANEIALPSVLPNENGACQEDAGSFSEANNNLSNNLASNERAVRKAKKRKDGDMAYEGDTAWEVLELEHFAVADRDQGARSRGRLCSSSNIDPDLETGRVAAVSVGLKAHAVGPVEKIKFKEVLKRKGGLQEYFECRNKILSLWNKDVTRILPFTDCGVTTIPSDNEASCASLMRDIYSFLDQSGYINAGIATNKEKAEPHSRGNYKLLGEKKFEGSSGASVADSADGVSFILGQVKSADTISKTKNDLALDDENPSKQAVKRDEERVFDPSPDKLHDECKDVEMLDKQQTDVKISEIIVGAECSPAKVVGESLENDAVCNHLMTPGRLEGSDYMHHDLKNQKRIIVVGAGPAGLTAARHLQRQGLGVTVLEARSRIGGRVYTDRSSLSVPVDLGASIITGVEADVTSERRPDPSSLVCAQLGLELTILNSDCPLYDIVTGQKVPTDVDEALEAEFNSLLDDMVLVVAQKGESAARMSLEDGLEYGLKMRHKGDGESKILRPQVASFNHGNGNDGCSAQKGGVKDKTVSPLERRVMDWHFAHLEYGCAALLKDVSLPHWNQDDVYGGFGGAHCMIKGGYGAVVESIAQGLSIHLNQVVADVSYGGMDLARVDNCSHKVKVSTSSGNEFFGDAVLITVPLGCLKAESIKFSPPLPEWKHSAIQRLGFGILNKVVLEFAEVFWDDTVDYFGATAEQTDLRGRCFMFWNVKKTVGAPVLIALLVGKAALDGQDVNPSEQVSHAVAVLRKLFGDAAVPDPVASVVTNWGRDPFSYGAYSYVAVGSSGEDYDILGRPVENCLFFAGEATCKEHPDTVGGAMMSGLREAVRIIDILNTGNDYTAEAEAIEAAQRQSNSERNEVKDIARRLDDLSDVLFKSPLHKSQALARESLLKDMFFSAKTSAGRLRLAKELLNLPVESLKSFAGTREGLSVLNSWILDSMGKDATQLLRHCVRILVFVSTDLVAVRLSGIGKTVKEKVCVHTSRDIRSIASQLVNIWIEVFRKEKATNGGLKLLRHMANSDSVKARGKGSRKPPISVHHCATGSKTPLSSKKPTGKQVKLETGTGSKTESKVEQDENLPLSEEERAAVAAAEAAHAAALAAAEAYASSEARFSKMQLPKIPSFQKFARQEQYGQMDESEKKRWSGGVLGRQDCISEIDSRNCRVRDWSVDFSAACANLDPSRLSADNLSQRSLSNDMPQLNWREHSGESAAGDSSAFTKAWVDSSGSVGIKDYHAIERWQCQAAAAEYEFQSSMHIGDEEDSSSMSKLLPRKHEGLVNESSVSQVTVNKELTVNQRRGAEHIKQGVVDYVASLLMPLYKSRKIDRDGYKSIMKKSATKVMEQTTDAEKAMAVSEFLDFKRKNKIRAFVDKLIERHMAMKPVVKP